MANSFKNEDDNVYRVVGHYFEPEASEREAKGYPRYRVLAGPYASRAVARAARTRSERGQSWLQTYHNVMPKYERFEVEECVPVWAEIPH